MDVYIPIIFINKFLLFTDPITTGTIITGTAHIGIIWGITPTFALTRTGTVANYEINGLLSIPPPFSEFIRMGDYGNIDTIGVMVVFLFIGVATKRPALFTMLLIVLILSGTLFILESISWLLYVFLAAILLLQLFLYWKG